MPTQQNGGRKPWQGLFKTPQWQITFLHQTQKVVTYHDDEITRASKATSLISGVSFADATVRKIFAILHFQSCNDYSLLTSLMIHSFYQRAAIRKIYAPIYCLMNREISSQSGNELLRGPWLLLIFSVSESLSITNGNRSEWSLIRSVIIRRVITKSDRDLVITSMITDRHMNIQTPQEEDRDDFGFDFFPKMYACSFTTGTHGIQVCGYAWMGENDVKMLRVEAETFENGKEFAFPNLSGYVWTRLREELHILSKYVINYFSWVSVGPVNLRIIVTTDFVDRVHRLDGTGHELFLWPNGERTVQPVRTSKSRCMWWAHLHSGHVVHVLCQQPRSNVCDLQLSLGTGLQHVLRAHISRHKRLFPSTKSLG